MNPVATFFVGIAPDHVPALVAALLLPLFVWIAQRVAASPGVAAARPSAGAASRWATWLLGIAAAVHLALPLGHHDSPLLTVGFLGSGTAYAWVALQAREGRRWRLPTALLVPATLVGYLIVVGGGGEEADQVGIATALAELAAFGLAVVPSRVPGRPRRMARIAGSAATVTAVVLVGAVVWVGSFAAHKAAETASLEGGTAIEAATVEDATAAAGGHRHGHEHAARAQAGVILRPLLSHHPTAAQQRSATALAVATKAATARFADLRAALSAGYKLPFGKGRGTDVHLDHDDYKKDGRTLDPQRPEMLVYAIEGGRATLLGVVFVMEVAGAPGPAPGGPVTGWHAHNICISVLPPGLGVVSPFGGCPAFSLNLTSSEMMHVWVVDNPAGPFAEGLDEAWVRAYHASHGRDL